MRESEKGFTLVELSIVLVIIGLLISGLLVAQSMIGTARIQAQVRQFQQFDVAVTNFHTKFNQIPGDTNLSGNHNFGSENDGIINGAGSPPAPYSESYFFFPDLYTMGAIQDRYQWENGSFTIGINHQYPAAAIGRGGIAVSGNGNGDLFYISLSQSSAAASWTSISPVGNFSNSEALALDTKIDDGNPTSGDVEVISYNLATSAAYVPFILDSSNSNWCNYNGAYNINKTGTDRCRLAVKSQFH